LPAGLADSIAVDVDAACPNTELDSGGLRIFESASLLSNTMSVPPVRVRVLVAHIEEDGYALGV
jgi:hypothetical protein